MRKLITICFEKKADKRIRWQKISCQIVALVLVAKRLIWEISTQKPLREKGKLLMKNENYFFMAVLLAALTFCVPPVSAGLIVNVLDAGWHDNGQRSVHGWDAISGEYVGAFDAQGVPMWSYVYRGYYVFDLSEISTPASVTAAVLHTGYRWGSVDTSETFRIYDADADSILSLGNGFHTSDPLFTYEDLGSGHAYADFMTTNSATTFDVELNSLALSDLTASLGLKVGFGFDLLTNDPAMQNENVWFTPAPTLELTIVPEPATILIILASGLLLRRKT